MNRHVIYFTADWCNPCKRIRPIAEELERDGIVKFQIVDVDSNVELAKNFQVSSIPTFIVIEDNQEVRRITGAPPTRNALLGFIEGTDGSN